ncbi:hypothetical protein WDJ51_15045 [Rathayibacter sp. YIM 133350]|uniref:hypothetical protein n=1 Tax=Rathayibacter sp. YIM 133350 TaxID=3131992 RepID=UPI00307F12BB
MSQDQPIQRGHDDATHDERVEGILVQLEGDLRLGNAGDPQRLLADRLRDSGIELSPEQLRAASERLTVGLEPGVRPEE